MSPTNERDAGFCSGGSENEEDVEMALINNNNNNSNENIDNNNTNNSNNNFHLRRIPPTTDKSEDSAMEDKHLLLSTSLAADATIAATATPTITATSTISTVPKNKRKSSEPIRVVVSESTHKSSQSGPIKKRFIASFYPYSSRVASVCAPAAMLPEPTPDPTNPFRPWTAASNLVDEPPSKIMLPTPLNLNPAHSFKRHPGVTTLHRVRVDEIKQEPMDGNGLLPEQVEPIALVISKKRAASPLPVNNVKRAAIRKTIMGQRNGKLPPPTLSSATNGLDFRVSQMSACRTPTFSLNDDNSSTGSAHFLINTNNSSAQIGPGLISTSLNLSTKSLGEGSDGGKSCRNQAPSQRNYKNMTRERRIEANARERTRVHTISAAFDKLRHTIPSYSNTQKLSKLSVLRVACSYIMSLARVAGKDYSEDQSQPPLGECVENLTRTIQTEGKQRKKKDE